MLTVFLTNVSRFKLVLFDACHIGVIPFQVDVSYGENLFGCCPNKFNGFSKAEQTF